jgi:hypothetical protein
MNNQRPTTHRRDHAAKPARANENKGTAKSSTAFRRRDATGHLDPAYAVGLRAIERETEPLESPNPDGFLHGMRSADPLAEELGEDFVRTLNSGEDDAQDDEQVTEEIGGPFVETTGDVEFAVGTDSSNPAGATREPFPTS